MGAEGLEAGRPFSAKPSENIRVFAVLAPTDACQARDLMFVRECAGTEEPARPCRHRSRSPLSRNKVGRGRKEPVRRNGPRRLDSARHRGFPLVGQPPQNISDVLEPTCSRLPASSCDGTSAVAWRGLPLPPSRDESREFAPDQTLNDDHATNNQVSELDTASQYPRGEH
ncbi:hypothetical protein B0T16DRAFT_204034 [Cercophora newfieldiana]|uniref:Uncharacterized protein n=1 Tax=Cercophora newfieldiana TaxID=92897 RepID=A0AA39XV98_9PEZI|nr:hypothetical protein B0T16DRAFT_204034 [Cercophora newfieldiana]